MRARVCTRACHTCVFGKLSQMCSLRRVQSLGVVPEGEGFCVNYGKVECIEGTRLTKL